MPFCPKCRDEFQDWVKKCPTCKVVLVEKLGPVMKPCKPPSPRTENLATVASYCFPTEAHIAAAKLESEGIWSFVADERMVNVNWLYSNAIGGVRLQVREFDIKKAVRILNATVKNTEDLTYNKEKCPQCNSTNIKYERFNLRLVFGFWFVSFLFIGSYTVGAAGILLPFFKHKWKCNACGYEWKEKT